METAYHPLSTMDSTYQPVSPSEKRPTQHTQVSMTSFFSRKSSSRTTISRPRSQIWHWLALLVAFLWLLPIAALLALNFKVQIIGPSAWCPFGHCHSDAGDEDAIMKANRLDKNDHNLLGALQFVAKTLEVWFMFIATALLYDLAMIMARQEGGLPVGYVLTHLEFGDIRNLFNPTLWTSPFPNPHATHSQKHRKSVSRLFLFALLAALLTVLANLMGPATAVLVLPTLQYLDTPHKVSQVYRSIHLDRSPTGDTALDGCDAAQLTAGNYSCTAGNYSSSLDQFGASAVAGGVQGQLPYGDQNLPALAQESSVMFSVNQTSNDSVIWIPNPQVLAALSLDLFQLLWPNDYGHPATPIDESLQLTLNRQGPSIGFDFDCYAGNVTMVKVAKDKEIHCFGNWTDDDSSYYYTKCIRIGPGFNAANTDASMRIGNKQPNTTATSSALDIYYTDLVTYYNSTYNTQIIPCISNKTAPTCDWDALFALPAPFDDSLLSPNHLLFLSFSLPDAAEDYTPYVSNSRLFCQAAAHVSFPNYTLDTLTSTNPIQLVQMQGLSPKSDSLPISPSWLLAAFSADADPKSDANTVEASRAIAQAFSSVFHSAWLNSNNDDSYEWTEFTFLVMYSLGQAMSMVRYDETNVTASRSSKSTLLPPSPKLNAKATVDPTVQRTLHTWSTRRVWAYSIYQSRTSKLGASVAILGVLCVLLRLVLGVTLGKREYTPVELLVAALEHEYKTEFDGLEGEERKLAKVRYMMVEESGEGDNRQEGKLKFVPEERWK